MSLELRSAPAGGTGRTQLLFVHGICHGAWCWTDTYLPYFAGLGYDAHALSLRGHAGSDGREQLHRAVLADYVDDVLTVARSLPTPPVLIGHSMGGAVVALAAPQADLAGVVLLAPMVPGGLTGAELRRLARSVRSMSATVRLLLGTSLSAASVNRLPFFSGRLSGQTLETARAALQPESRRAIRDLVGFAPPPRSITAPMLVLGSEQDALFGAGPLRRTAEHYGCPLVVLPQGCHDLMLDPAWRDSAEQIRQWLQRSGL